MRNNVHINTTRMASRFSAPCLTVAITVTATSTVTIISGKRRFLIVAVCMCLCLYGHHLQQSMNQPGKVANPARGQLNRENECFPVPVRA